MSNIVAADEAQAAGATNVALWILQAVLAFQFAGGGLLKLTGSPEMVELFAAVGAGQWLRYMVGTLEVAGAGPGSWPAGSSADPASRGCHDTRGGVTCTA